MNVEAPKNFVKNKQRTRNGLAQQQVDRPRLERLRHRGGRHQNGNKHAENTGQKRRERGQRKIDEQGKLLRFKGEGSAQPIAKPGRVQHLSRGGQNVVGKGGVDEQPVEPPQVLLGEVRDAPFFETLRLGCHHPRRPQRRVVEILVIEHAVEFAANGEQDFDLVVDVLAAGVAEPVPDRVGQPRPDAAGGGRHRGTSRATPDT